MANILPGPHNSSRQKIMNAQRTGATNNAKSGVTARRLADLREQENKASQEFNMSKKKTIKVNSNPVPSQPRTTGGITGAGAKNVGKVYRSGGGGLGGIFGNKIR